MTSTRASRSLLQHWLVEHCMDDSLGMSQRGTILT